MLGHKGIGANPPVLLLILLLAVATRFLSALQNKLMKNTIISLFTVIILTIATSQSFAQADTTKADTTKADTTNPVKKPDDKPDKPFDWAQQVWGPVVRLACILIIIGALLGFLDLRHVLSRSQWSERTILALAIVLTFCIASLINIADEVFRALKDVALVVVGFYFGAAKGSETQPKSGEQPHPTDAERAAAETKRKEAETAAKAEAEKKKLTGGG